MHSVETDSKKLEVKNTGGSCETSLPSGSCSWEQQPRSESVHPVPVPGAFPARRVPTGLKNPTPICVSSFSWKRNFWYHQIISLIFSLPFGPILRNLSSRIGAYHWGNISHFLEKDEMFTESYCLWEGAGPVGLGEVKGTLVDLSTFSYSHQHASTSHPNPHAVIPSSVEISSDVSALEQ